MKITKRSVDALPPQSRELIAFDEEVKGFGIRVRPSGIKTYLVQYRSGGRTRRVKLGRYGVVTADQARTHAKEILGAVARGNNPAQDIREHRRAATVATVCERLFRDHVVLHCKPNTQREYRRSIDLFIKPAIGAFKVVDVTRADMAQLHHQLRDRPFQANRTLGVLSKLFNLCEVWGLRPDGSNPCRHIKKYPEHRREVFLNSEELTRLGQAMAEAEADGSESASAIAAFRLLILTGCRLSEIQTLKWAYISDGYIKLPDSKTGPRRIPLPEAAANVLAALPHQPGNEYVIAGKLPGTHLTDLQPPWQRLRKKAGLEHVRIHDLRHTYASNAIMNGIDIVVVGRLLGHSQIQTTMRYAHLADEPVRKAAARVSGVLGQALRAPVRQSGNVVTLPVQAPYKE